MYIYNDHTHAATPFQPSNLWPTWFFRGRRTTMYAKAKTKVPPGAPGGAFFQGRSARMYPGLPTWAPGKWEIPNYKPYSSWEFMGKLSPRILRLNTINKYHGSTRTLGVSRPCPLIFGDFAVFF